MAEKIKSFFRWCWRFRLSILTGIIVLIFVVTFIYYWITTPSTAVLVSADDFPTSLSLGFTPDALIDRTQAHINDVIIIANSAVTSEIGAQVGSVPQPISQKVIPGSALSSIPTPIFRYKWHGFDLNLVRGWGMSLKAKRVVEIEVIGLPEGGWRLAATLKEAPQYSPQSAGSAPRHGGRCLDPESCAADLSEQILEKVNYRPLLSYYIKLNTDDGSRRVLELYQSVPGTAIQADDLVAWGNAFYALHRYDDALQKYQEALARDSRYCPARLGRGLVFYYRNHGKRESADLKHAEEDFASSCGENNKFARANLCSTLIREWRTPAKRDPKSPLLTRAQDNCAAALKIDQRFTRAAVSAAYILYRQEQYQESFRQFAQMADQYPTDSGLFATYGFVLYREYVRRNESRFLDQAIDRTLQSWKLNETNYAATNNVGDFYYEKGDYTRAVEFLKKAVLLRGDDPDVRAGLALALDKTNEDGAFASFIEAVRLDPSYCYPQVLKLTHDWSDRAASDLAELIGKLPDNLKADVQDLCGATRH